MKKTSILAAFAALVVFPLASQACFLGIGCDDNDQTSSTTVTNTANGGAGGAGGSASAYGGSNFSYNPSSVSHSGNSAVGNGFGNLSPSANVRNHVNNRNSNHQGQGQDQGQLQGQIGINKAVGTGNTTVVEGDTYEAPPRAPVTPAWAAPVVFSSDDQCYTSVNGGGQGITFGASLSVPVKDGDCVRRKDSRELRQAGHALMGLAVLCDNNRLKEAAERVGTAEERYACGVAQSRPAPAATQTPSEQPIAVKTSTTGGSFLFPWEQNQR